MQVMENIRKSSRNKLIIFQIITVYVLASFMAGCGVSPNHITFEERQQRVIDDWNTVFNQDDVLSNQMTMEMAMARALKYNLDIKVQTYESLLGDYQLDVSNLEMMPQLLGSIGYLSRSNHNASKSFNITTQTENFSHSVSQEKTRSNGGLQFSWNLLDFGASYIAAKQSADQFLIGLQRNRKIAQNVMRDVRNSYWQAYTAQEVEKDLIPLMEEVRLAIKSSQIASSEKLSPELDNLSYRRSLYDILRNLTELQKNLVEAKANLSALTVVPPGKSYTLLPSTTEKNPLPEDFPMELPLLEKIALYDRPELQEADYLSRISLAEIDKARLEMLPGLNLTYGFNYDSNKFMLNRTWAEAGTQLSWNLLKVFSSPASIRAAKASKSIVSLQRMALSVVVITQVDVAYYRYKEAVNELDVNSKLLDVDTNIQDHMVKQFNENTTDLLTLIRAKANKILAKLRHNLAYAEWQNSGGQLLSSIGYDLTAGIDTTAPLPNIATSVQMALNQSPEVNSIIDQISHIPGFNEPYREPTTNIATMKNEGRNTPVKKEQRQIEYAKDHLPESYRKPSLNESQQKAFEKEKQQKESLPVVSIPNESSLDEIAREDRLFDTYNRENVLTMAPERNNSTSLSVVSRAEHLDNIRKAIIENKSEDSPNVKKRNPALDKEASYLSALLQKWSKKNNTNISDVIRAFDFDANASTSTTDVKPNANNEHSPQVLNIKQQLKPFKETSPLAKNDGSDFNEELTKSAYKLLATRLNTINREKNNLSIRDE